MRTSHTRRRHFAWGSSKVKKTFFCESPFTAFPGGRRTYEGRHDGKLSSWIKNVIVVFGVYFPFDMIGRIPAWPRKMAIMETNYYPRAYRTKEVIFVHCLLNWMLTTKIYTPNTCYSYGFKETLWSVRISISRALYYVVLHFVLQPFAADFGMGDMWFKNAVM